MILDVSGRRRRPPVGMTLIELIVALTITGLALGFGYSAYAQLADRRVTADKRADRVAQAAAIRSTLVSWLSGARLTVEEDDIVFRSIGGVRRAPSGDVRDDDLTFFTSARTPVSNAGTVIHLFVSSDTIGERGLIAELSEWRGHQRARIQVDSAVSGFDVSLKSSVAGTEPWLTSWVSSTILPAGVRIVLTARIGDSLPPLLQMPITVSLENGR
jgi:prepilin-type N-terminal cleavage/methylation domain-containing protein